MLTAVSSCLVLSGTSLWWCFTQSDEAGWWDTAPGCCLSVTGWHCPLDPCCSLQLCHADPPQLLHCLQPALVTLCTVGMDCDTRRYGEQNWALRVVARSFTLFLFTLGVDSTIFTSDVANTLSLKIFCLCYMQDTSLKAIMPYCTNMVIEVCGKKNILSSF